MHTLVVTMNWNRFRKMFRIRFCIFYNRSELTHCVISVSHAFPMQTHYNSLRVRAFFHKTVRVCHVYCNFKLGFTCRIIVIFGTLKDGSLLINTLASKICFSYRNMFQNGFNALSKIVDAFLSKTSKFYLVRIIWKCSNFASLWHKYLLRNYKWHFRLPMLAFAMAIWNTISKHQLFTLNFAFQLFQVSTAIDNCRSQKYYL